MDESEGRELEPLARVTVAVVVADGSIMRLKESELECTVIVNEPAALLGSGELELEVAVTLGD